MSKRQKLSDDEVAAGRAASADAMQIVPAESESLSSLSPEAAADVVWQIIHTPLLTDCSAFPIVIPAETSDEEVVISASTSDEEDYYNYHELVQPEVVSALPEEMCSVASGWTTHYCSWWHKQAPQNSKHTLFPAQLIGDASTPHLYTPMSLGDLAFCSNWGRKLVEDHSDKNQALPAVLPVLTTPNIVQESIAGMLAGQIKLSETNFEQVLVLANAVGFEALEETCLAYLHAKLSMLNS